MLNPIRVLILAFVFGTTSHLAFTSTHVSVQTSFAATAVATFQDSAAAEIVFPSGNVIALPVRGLATVKAYVLDEHHNRIDAAQVDWQLADPDNEAFVFVGNNVNKDGVNSVNLTWLGGRADLKFPTEIKLVARSGSKARGIVTIKYEAPAPETVKLSTEAKTIMVEPGDSVTVEVTATGDDNRLLKDLEITGEIADATASKYLLVTTNKQTVNVIGVAGDGKAPPFLRTALVVKAKGKTAMITVPVTYLRQAVSIVWSVLPAGIVGDNYGRTIRNDYYCIEVTIQNNSGSELALAALKFDTTDDGEMPNASYTTVHGSLARRKLTHPRTLILAIIDATGSLMTGFNPFFHNLNHAKNYSQFIDILSNPLAKGLDKSWKDPYPDELARFEQDVLHDDKIISKDGGIFKTKIFVPKRDVFPDGEPKTNDLRAVRKALGTLTLTGYKFQKGQAVSVGSGTQ